MNMFLRSVVFASICAGPYASAYADGLWLMALFNAAPEQVEVSATLWPGWVRAPHYPKVAQNHMVADKSSYDDVRKGINYNNCAFGKNDVRNRVILDQKIENVSVPDWCDWKGRRGADQYDSPYWLQIKAGKKAVRLFRCDGSIYRTEAKGKHWKLIEHFRYTSYWGIAGFVAYAMPGDAIHVISK